MTLINGDYMHHNLNFGIIVSYLTTWHEKENDVSKLIDSYEDSYINLKAYHYQIKTINLESYEKL